MSVGLRLQDEGRPDQAVDWFDRAAWSSEDRGRRAQLLTEAAACAFAAGFWRRASALSGAARRMAPGPELTCVIDVLECAFRGSGSEPVSRRRQVAVARILLGWGQTSAAFVVLAACPAHTWSEVRAALFGLGRQKAPVAGVAMPGAGRAGLPMLERTAREFESRREFGAAAAAHALVGESAACLGQVSLATAALLRARQLAAETVQPRWLDRVALATSLLSVRRGQGVPPEFDRPAGAGGPVRQSRAELIRAVRLLAQEQWTSGYDVLADLIVRPAETVRDLTAWGLLSHLADAATGADRVEQTRALISALADTEGLFENDIEQAELLYATAVLADTAQADACYEVLLSHDVDHWPWLGARAHFARGEQLCRTRRECEGRRHLVSAQRLFTAMDSQPWERRVTHALRSAGARHTPPPGGSTGLSAQELDVVRLAARGMTNREIGAVLALSPRTVGEQLHRVFPKLGVTRRVQLKSALDGLREWA